MKRLTRKYIESIADKIVEAYMNLPEIKGKPIYRIEPELLITKVLGLKIEYAHLTLDDSILGLTAYNEYEIRVFDETDMDTFIKLDGKTVVIEKDLLTDLRNQGRLNFTLMHEAGHQIFKMLYPEDYGVRSNEPELHYSKANSKINGPITDWEEWQANTVGAAIFLPESIIKQGMYLFGLGDKIEYLNKIFRKNIYDRFSALADFLGASKQALAIRMKQLGLLENDYLENPFAMVEVEGE